ncbi:phosphonate C-P lyase system protein PhnG [Acidisphaera sp. L21]|uniref:phosphonate C-P lyase system protein PhnG n=1 Tax=Acidisphaera sp. L21 TaxID=1641851 RepID=UPI00131E37D0|nr:phosphonate C-P lyase system protein PhnG [Acidisphaera sp. L21]
MADEQDDRTERQRWMAVLARASAAEIDGLLPQCAPMPDYTVLRGPEAGLVMTRGRTGGGGAPFHVGEMTVARCSVRTQTGHTGHAYVAGRDLRQAELAALLDGVLQDPARQDVRDAVVAPLAARQESRRAEVAAKAGATRVQFFTMATMRG